MEEPQYQSPLNYFPFKMVDKSFRPNDDLGSDDGSFVSPSSPATAQHHHRQEVQFVSDEKKGPSALLIGGIVLLIVIFVIAVPSTVYVVYVNKNKKSEPSFGSSSDNTTTKKREIKKCDDALLQKIKDDKLTESILVSVVQDGCWPCMRFKPIFHKACSSIAIPAYEINLSEKPLSKMTLDFCKNYKITGTPTLLKFSHDDKSVTEFQNMAWSEENFQKFAAAADRQSQKP